MYLFIYLISIYLDSEACFFLMHMTCRGWIRKPHLSSHFQQAKPPFFARQTRNVTYMNYVPRNFFFNFSFRFIVLFALCNPHFIQHYDASMRASWKLTTNHMLLKDLIKYTEVDMSWTWTHSHSAILANSTTEDYVDCFIYKFMRNNPYCHPRYTK